MKLQEVIQLYDSGFLNNRGTVNQELLEELGAEDGKEVAAAFCKQEFCNVKILHDLEDIIKIGYCNMSNGQFLSHLREICEMAEVTLSDDVDIMLWLPDVIDVYFSSFVMGFSAIILEHYREYRQCRQYQHRE